MTDRRRDKGEETRKRIVGAATALMAEADPHGLTAAHIAERATVSKATLFHHYNSVAEIILEATLALLEASRQQLEANRPPTLQGYLEQVGEGVLQLLEHRPSLMRAVFSLLLVASEQPQLQERLRHTYEQAACQLQTGMAGYLGTPAPELHRWTLDILFMRDGLAINHALGTDPARLRDVWHERCRQWAAELKAPRKHAAM